MSISSPNAYSASLSPRFGSFVVEYPEQKTAQKIKEAAKEIGAEMGDEYHAHVMDGKKYVKDVYAAVIETKENDSAIKKLENLKKTIELSIHSGVAVISKDSKVADTLKEPLKAANSTLGKHNYHAESKDGVKKLLLLNQDKNDAAVKALEAKKTADKLTFDIIA
jgi:hypothetical protein